MQAQFLISGTVYDSTRSIPVKDVLVKSSGGKNAITDSFGRYSITASEKDSLSFFYNNKPTINFAVKQIENIGSFDISLHVRLTEKFKTLKEVRVYRKSYREDSLEYRQQYASIFKYQKPGISTSMDPFTGTAGIDINELINIFRFKRNRQLRKMQERLVEQEQENFINYRFNKSTVRRITRLVSPDLEIFMNNYRPDFEFTQNSTLVDFYQYILNASYQYRKEKLLKGNR